VPISLLRGSNEAVSARILNLPLLLRGGSGAIPAPGDHTLALYKNLESKASNGSHVPGNLKFTQNDPSHLGLPHMRFVGDI
jgi:hypothetical protein